MINTTVIHADNDQPNELEPLLTYTEVSEQTGIPLGTLYTQVREERIPHLRLGPRMVRFRASALARHFAESERGVK